MLFRDAGKMGIYEECRTLHGQQDPIVQMLCNPNITTVQSKGSQIAYELLVVVKPLLQGKLSLCYYSTESSRCLLLLDVYCTLRVI